MTGRGGAEIHKNRGTAWIFYVVQEEFTTESTEKHRE